MTTTNNICTYIVPTATFEVTMPAQPAFLAYVDTTVDDVTGDSTIYTVCSDDNTTVYDQNADYDDAGTFTAPVDGQYEFIGIVTLDDIAAAGTSGRTKIDTSNRGYAAASQNTFAMSVAATGSCSLESNVLADMDAADTAIFTTGVYFMAKIVDVVGGAVRYSCFGGRLVC